MYSIMFIIPVLSININSFFRNVKLHEVQKTELCNVIFYLLYNFRNQYCTIHNSIEVKVLRSSKYLHIILQYNKIQYITITQQHTYTACNVVKVVSKSIK